MDIFVDGANLDLVPKKDILFRFTTLLFSGKIVDDYSIDFEIPRTENNNRILQPYGLRYLGQKYGEKIPCQVILSGQTLNSSLQVVKLTDNTITICVFNNKIPSAIADKYLNDIIHDDDTTLFKFPKPNDPVIPQAPTIDCGLFPFDMNNGEAVSALPSFYLPSIRVNKVLQMLTTATGITFPSFDKKYYLTATNRNVCPYNNVQYFDRVGFEQSAFNLYEKDVAPLTPSTLTFNRSLRASFDVTLTVYTTALKRLKIQLSNNNGGSWQLLKELDASGTGRPGQPPTPGVAKAKFNVNLNDGDIVRYVIDGDEGVGITTNITYSNVEHSKLLDEDTELLTDAGKYWARIGTISNLNKVKLKDFLTALCWQIGARIEFANNAITFVPINNAKSINAEIIEYSPITNSLGQNTTITDANGRVMVSKTFDNEFLVDSKALYKSSFLYPYKSNADIYINVPIYVKNADGGYDLKKIKGLPISEAFKPSRPSAYEAYLIPVNKVGNIEEVLNVFDKVLEIKATTFDDIRGYRFVDIDGLRYAVISGNYNVNTRSTKFTALQVTNKNI